LRAPALVGRITDTRYRWVVFSPTVIGGVVMLVSDRVIAPRIAIVLCLVGETGGVTLLLGGASYASITAIALGLTLGAELDLMGCLVSRYFSILEFGRIYGGQYGAFILASGLGLL
jgi:hypothetical protein